LTIHPKESKILLGAAANAASGKVGKMSAQWDAMSYMEHNSRMDSKRCTRCPGRNTMGTQKGVQGVVVGNKMFLMQGGVQGEEWSNGDVTSIMW